MHPTLTAALPKLAAQIDTERPLIARAIADHVTLNLPQLEDDPLYIKVSDARSYELLSNGAIWNYLQTAFKDHGFRNPIISLMEEDPHHNSAKPTQRAPRTMLTLPQRSALMTWLQTRADLSTCPNSALATDASAALAYIVHASHVRSILESLGITKTKPTPPTTGEITLSALQKSVLLHGSWLTDISIKADGIEETLTALRGVLDGLRARMEAAEFHILNIKAHHPGKIAHLTDRIEDLEGAKS